MAARFAPWTTLERRQVWASPRGSIAIDVEKVALPDGRVIDDYYAVRMSDFALVFAEDENGGVLMLRHYRHGPRRACLTFPGGTLAERESPQAAAQRELLEETGYAGERWKPLGSYVTNANQGCNTAHLFRVSACRRVARAQPSDLEDSELVVVPRRDLMAPGALAEIGLASHVALLALATHPAFGDTAA